MHFGPTSQDAIDTALMLQVRDAVQTRTKHLNSCLQGIDPF